MKKYLQLICGPLLLFAAVILLSPAVRAADPGRTITLEGKVDMLRALDGAKDGDIIELNGSVGITDMSSKDAPWVIDKAVTIQGGTLGLWAGGIILDADVTFRNTTLSFDLFVRNAIMANGHTLTLENVRCDQGTRSVNLFCGGLYDPGGFGSSPGAEGKIMILGNTSLKGDSAPGNLYAGNLCMGGMNEADSEINGPENQYNGNASILIESSNAELGGIYAGGAQQKIPAGSTSGKVILTDPAKYTTGGRVDISLLDGTAKNVDGAGAGEVHVTYNGNAYSTALTLTSVSGLTVASGSLTPAAGSGFLDGAVLSVSGDAKLDLTSLGNLTVGSFSGGGTLLLGQGQSLSVTGSVTGCTTVGIFSLNSSGMSTVKPIEEHPYVKAPQSGPDAFKLAPPNGDPDMQFIRNENGDWSVPANDAPVLVENVWFVEDHISVESESEAALCLNAQYVDNGALPYIDFIPLTIIVNGSPTDRHVDEYGYYVYTTQDNKLSMFVSEDTVYAEGPDGTYSIEVIIPAAHTDSGQILSARTVLTVGAGTAPEQDLPCRIRSASVEDAQVVVDIAGGTAAGGTVIAAAYTENGRMCGISSVPVTGEGTVSVPLDSSEASYVTVFIVDRMDSMKPICRDQSIPKHAGAN